MSHNARTDQSSKQALAAPLRRRRRRLALVVLMGLMSSVLTLATASAASAATPTCESAASDPDGDGWGWENNQSCKVAVQQHEPTPTPTPASTPTCTSPDSDTDGDGWGWENNRSCTAPNGLGNLPRAYSRSCWTLEDFTAGCTMSGGRWTPELASHMERNGLASPGTDLGARVQIISDSARTPYNNKVLYIVGPYLPADLQDPEGRDFDTVRAEVAELFNGRAPGVRAAADEAINSGATVVYISFGYAPNADLPLSMRVLATRNIIRNFERVRPSLNSGNDSMLIGVSLGGVAAKHALHELEVEGFDHGVDTFLSWDSPHNGAHIPEAIQNVPVFLRDSFDDVDSGFVQTFWDAAGRAEDNADNIIKLTLHNPVARDVLIDNIEFPNREDAGVLLDSQYPQDSFNVALASGSIDGTRPNLGRNILTIDTGEASDLDLRVRMNITHADLAGTDRETFWGQTRWRKPLFWKDSQHSDSISLTQAQSLTTDRAACGLDSIVVRELRAQLLAQFQSNWNGNASVIVGEDETCFLPTASAFDMGWVTVNGRRQWQSGFDRTIGDSSNNEHMEIENSTRSQVVALVSQTLR